MNDDERAALANWIGRGTGSDAEKRRQAAKVAAQLRADGERIKALRDELATCRRTFLLAIQAAGGKIAIPLTAVRVCPQLTLVRENKDLTIVFSVTKTPTRQITETLEKVQENER